LNDEIKNELQKLNYDVQVINPATCLQLIMKKNNTFYGYGDFRRPDAFASGDIYD
jgi:gamma-glutamyltranspeptidase/glutathione hydrolase